MFLCNLLSWTKLYIAEGQCPYLTSLIGWPFTERGSSFLLSLVLFLAPSGDHCIRLVYFGAPFLAF